MAENSDLKKTLMGLGMVAQEDASSSKSLTTEVEVVEKRFAAVNPTGSDSATDADITVTPAESATSFVGEEAPTIQEAVLPPTEVVCPDCSSTYNLCPEGCPVCLQRLIDKEREAFLRAAQARGDRKMRSATFIGDPALLKRRMERATRFLTMIAGREGDPWWKNADRRGKVVIYVVAFFIVFVWFPWAVHYYFTHYR